MGNLKQLIKEYEDNVECLFNKEDNYKYKAIINEDHIQRFIDDEKYISELHRKYHHRCGNDYKFFMPLNKLKAKVVHIICNEINLNKLTYIPKDLSYMIILKSSLSLDLCMYLYRDMFCFVYINYNDETIINVPINYYYYELFNNTQIAREDIEKIVRLAGDNGFIIKKEEKEK